VAFTVPALAVDLVWPLGVVVAWIAGELGHRWLALPRISVYAVVGFGLGQSGLLPAGSSDSMLLLVNVAFGLVLFEFGYRINLRWLRLNAWISATGVLEAACAFAAVYAVARASGMPQLTTLLLASLAMSTSPAVLMRVVNEQRSSGQVTERVLHIAAINCVMAVFVFKVTVGFWTFQSSGNLGHAVSNSLLVLVVSAGLGAAFGVGVAGLLRRVIGHGRDATVAFALAVVLLVTTTHAFGFSPVFATLTFGLVARHRRVLLSQAQRNFGVLGDLLSVLLFVFVATTLEWHRVATGLLLALALIAVRLAAKVAVVVALAHVSGLSWRKGALTGLALTPVSVFAILLLEEASSLGLNLVDLLAPLAAATLLLEIVGPIVTQWALIAAGEAAESQRR
jgi:Kef-type K+ transport system membrane component KefB